MIKQKHFYCLLLLILALVPAWAWTQFTPNGSDLYHLNGEVGIGTDSPDRDVHVFDERTGAPGLYDPIEAISTGIRMEYKFRYTSFSSFTNYRWDQYVNHKGYTIYDRRQGQHRLFIDNNGNVGIGLTNPTHRLQVSGTGRIDNLGLGGNATNNDLEVYGTGRVRDRLYVGDNSAGISARLTADNSISGGPEVAFHALGNNSGVNTQNTVYVIAQGAWQQNQGVFSRAQGTCIGQGEGSYAIGLAGQAAGADQNMGVYGRVYDGTACKNGRAYGVYGYAASTNGSTFAGFFSGNTFSPGGVWTSSDRKLKQGIEDVGPTTEKLMQLAPRTYEFKREEFEGLNLPEGQQYGFLAQELATVFPEMTMEISSPNVTDESGKLEHASVDFTAVNYQSMIPLLVKGFQEQQTVIEEQAREIESLKSALAADPNGKWSGNAVNGFGEAAVLGQNLPNPFDGMTQIPYFLPESVSSAQLMVFDLNGTQLKAETLTPRGEGTFKLDLSALPAGMYLYSLVADGKEVATKRMILRK